MLLRLTVLAPSMALACCVAPPPETAAPPPPVAVPAPTPAPPPPVVQQPVYANFLDAPQTPGNWRYGDRPNGGFATFGGDGEPAMFGIECSRRAGSVRLVRTARANDRVAMRIRTETTQRLWQAVPNPSGTPTVIVDIPASDPLLDAIALSRGRFAIETEGFTTLYLPAWAEVTRVIEDCR
ncbi:hypothetical protein GRI94_13195 [Erythrobacter jejuensis]|uniref:Uncharacterized protein n=2 Tax=Parerythrobacter jejuensis TaxID=795812 RepID=A0A845AR45_9SPHN|nr:hypothetical protein [Parerythrobacter jejuensis]